MAQIIGVRFQSAGKIYFFDAGELEISLGDYVIVETVKGIEFAEVSMGKRFMEDEELKAPLKPVLRKATQQDIAHAVDNRNHEKEAFGICQKKIGEHKLEMKLVGVEAAFDNSKLTFYFTANGRVDFRSLVKDLASVFKTRIELRQIGVRDEARMIGGLGPCGRQICCGAFLEDFEPVSIKMAKEQNLSLNPTKISGVCGRLMCCLKYEEEDYETTRKRMPRIGKEVITPDGNGTVTDLNIVKETVKVRIAKGDSFEINEYELEKIRKPGAADETGTEIAADSEDGMTETDEMTDEAHFFDENEEEKNPDSKASAETETPSAKETEEAPEANQDNSADKTAAQTEEKPAERGAFKPRHPLGQPVQRERKDRPANRDGRKDFRKENGREGNKERPDGNVQGENGMNRNRDRHGKPNFQNRPREDRQQRPAPAPVKQEAPKPVESAKPAESAKPKTNWAAQLEQAMAAAESRNKG